MATPRPRRSPRSRLRSTTTRSSERGEAATVRRRPYNQPMVGGLVAVGFGAMLGAWLRWGLSLWLNGRVPHFPLGTLASNLIGGYLVGFAVAFFAVRHDLSPELRLSAITGFLGGLTTFSTFSAE